MDCVTSEMHKFTIKQEKNQNISICGLDTNKKSPCIMCVQYIGGYSVHRDIMRTLGDIMSTSGFSTEIERIYQVAPPHAS